MGIVKQIIKALTNGLDQFIQGILDGISENLFEPLLQTVFGLVTKTPYPNNIYSFGAPTNGDWPLFYNQIYVAKIQALITPLFGLVLGVAMFFGIFGRKEKKIAMRRAIFVFPFAYSWWWFGGWFLKLNHHFTQFLIDGSAEQMSNDIGSMLLTISGGIGAGVVVYTIGAGVLFALILMFKLREILIYAYMIIMPVLLLLWIVPIDSVQGWAKSQMGKFVPVVFMTVPAALFIDIGTTLIGNASGPDGALMGIVTMGGAVVVSKGMFSYSGQVTSAVRTASQTGKAAAHGATNPNPQQSRGGLSRSGSSRGRQDSSQVGDATGGSSSQSDRDHLSHTGGVDFSPSMSRRRRQRQRAEKLGRGARKAAGKTKRGVKSGVAGAGNRLVESGAKNYYSNENTAKGMAKDAASSAADTARNTVKKPYEGGQRAVQGASKRMQKINRRIKARQQELKDQYTPTEGPRSLKEVNAVQSNLGNGSNDAPDSNGSNRAGAGSQSSSSRTTYSRNKSSREVGSLGSSNRNSEERT